MKINICIVDDEPKDAVLLAGYLSDYDNIEIHTVESYEQMQQQPELLRGLDIAFIDIQIGNHTGFDAVKLIQHYAPDCILAFFTNYDSYLKQGYGYRIYRYILKEEPEDLIKKEIKEIFDEFYKLNSFVKIQDKVIRLDNVIYIDILNHTATFHMTDSSNHSCNMPLKNIIEKIPDSFVRCHKSYIVNLKYIKSLCGRKKVIMCDNTEIAIGYAYKKAFIEQYSKNQKLTGGISICL